MVVAEVNALLARMDGVITLNDTEVEEKERIICEAKGLKADLDIAKKEVENLTSQLGDRDKQLKDLKNSTDDVEGLKTKIAHQVI